MTYSGLACQLLLTQSILTVPSKHGTFSIQHPKIPAASKQRSRVNVTLESQLVSERWPHDSCCINLTSSVTHPLSAVLVSQRWHTENHFRLSVPHRAMPSLCLSAFCCTHRGLSHLTAPRGELEEEEEEVYCRFGHSRTWVQKQGPCSKASKLAFGRPRCKAFTALLSSPARAWGWLGGQERLCAAPCCPTGNDTQVVSLQSMLCSLGEPLSRCCMFLAGCLSKT